MQFKDLKPNNTLFILDRKSVDVIKASVLDVSSPHYDPKYSGSVQVVDVTVGLEGRNTTYTFQHDSEVGYVDSNNLILTTNRDIVLREVEIIKDTADKELSMMDTYKTNSEKCAKILAEFDPRVKEKQENDRRLNELEASMVEMKSSVNEMNNMLKGFIEEFKK